MDLHLSLSKFLCFRGTAFRELSSLVGPDASLKVLFHLTENHHWINCLCLVSKVQGVCACVHACGHACVAGL